MVSVCRFPENYSLGMPLFTRQGSKQNRSSIFPLLINGEETDLLVKVFPRDCMSALAKERMMREMIGDSEFFIFGQQFYEGINGQDVGFTMRKGLYDGITFFNKEVDSPHFNLYFVLYQLLLALREFHTRGITYFDMKFDNFIVNKTNGPYAFISLIDFESAIFKGEFKAERFSLFYCPPEFFQSYCVSPATDIWAIGIIAYVFFVHVHPFSSFWDQREIKHHLTRSKVRITDGVEEFDFLDEKIQDFIKLCLNQDPLKRAKCSDLLEHAIFKDQRIDERFIEEQRSACENGSQVQNS